MRPNLRDVTVCAADTVAPQLAARALERCLDRADFGDAILFSDRSVPGRFRNVAIAAMPSIEAYSNFCLTGMPRHIATDFALVVQWDGYVVHPEAWNNDFRQYDYIGAPYRRRDGTPVMGNGGFSWRSRKLLQALAWLSPERGVPEDVMICLRQRGRFETEFGIRYAPEAAARRFCHDVEQPAVGTFGFHGARNFLRYEDERTVIAIFEQAPAAVFLTGSFLHLMLIAAGQKATLATGVALYRIARRYYPQNRLAKAMSSDWRPERAGRNVALLERYMREQDVMSGYGSRHPR
ncbi:MAG TPA: DUF5672 family protein [Bauldia sp.]|nr:DUF5672 family protein [Bauldia sp.]